MESENYESNVKVSPKLRYFKVEHPICIDLDSYLCYNGIQPYG
jgi:hypothetical protein